MTQRVWKFMGGMLAMGLLSATLVAQPTATRYDNQIQATVSQRLAAKKQFQEVKSTVEDGIVTLTGTVDLYQRKLDAARLARKTSNVQGVRNLITVAGPNVPDAQIEQKLAQDGVVTVEGQDLTGVGRDEALADIANMPGVKDVVSNISVEPTSIFDDGIRLRTARAIYRDPVLSKYAIDPARSIRIIVANGHVTLYGSVNSPMDKQIAGLRANQVFGAFSVENKLVVERDGGQSGM